MFLPPEVTSTQNSLNEISRWTDNSKMSINITKTNFIIFTRSKTKFTTRFMVNVIKIDQVKEQKICGSQT